MEDMKVYLFAQALDNNSSDDWYEYTNNSLEEITEESDQSWLNNLIFELTGEGKREVFNNVECYYRLTHNEFIDFIFLIESQQKDDIGRLSKTALIIKNYSNLTLDFEKILTLFWIATDRNSIDSNFLAKQCGKIFDIVKKKRNKRWWLVPLVLISLSIILVFFFQKFGKG